MILDISSFMLRFLQGSTNLPANGDVRVRWGRGGGTALGHSVSWGSEKMG